MNNAVTPWTSPVYQARVSEPNYLVAGLEPGTDYYWRIDEVWGDLPPFGEGFYYKGDVWKFTTAPAALNNDGSANLKDYPIPSNHSQKAGPILPKDIHKYDVLEYKD